MRDFNRQLGLIDPEEFAGKTITIIGAGATGSHIAQILAQMGIGYKGNGVISVWDFDDVEAHNLQNQAFFPKHIGMPKVDALGDLLKERFNVDIEKHNERVVDQRAVQTEYVFLLTDTMSSRKEIMEVAMKYSFKTEMVIETRMDIEEGRVYAFNPSNADELQAWKDTLYSDEEAETSMCGTSASIASTTHFISSLAVTRLVQHFRQESSALLTNRDIEKQGVPFSSMFSLYPEMFVTENFGEDPKVLA